MTVMLARCVRSLASTLFLNATTSTEISTLSLHDALPILFEAAAAGDSRVMEIIEEGARFLCEDRKSTRLNSSHPSISYAVFCLKKKIRLPLCSVQPCLAATRMAPYHALLVRPAALLPPFA